MADSSPYPGLPPYIIVFGPSANCTLDLCPLEYSVYRYRPSLPANIVFIVLYALALLVHAYLGFRWKQIWFMVCVILGCLVEIVGYIGRILMHGNPFLFAGFMTQIGKVPPLLPRKRKKKKEMMKNKKWVQRCREY